MQFRAFSRVLCALAIFTAAPVSAQPGEYLRFVDGSNEFEGELQTAIVHFENTEGMRVDLVAAVHLADPGYYQQLNALFADMDAVLFELVIDTGRDNGSSRRAMSTLGVLQTMIGNFLGLAFQLEGIDYTAANFVHADLTSDELQAVMAERNDSFMRTFMALARATPQDPDPDSTGNSQTAGAMSILQALQSDDSAAALKYLFAQELPRMESLDLAGQLEQELTILGARNARAISVLNRELQEDGNSHIALFYGAAHMPGLARDLRAMGYEEISTRWLTAWAL